MNQIGLFPPASRNTDPVTSHLAEAEATRSGAREAQIQRVLALVKKYPNKTSRELSIESLSSQEFRIWGLDRYIIARRCADLENLGLIRKGPKRECRIAGRLAVTWVIK